MSGVEPSVEPEGLLEVASGSEDIAVGIGGFGSARMDPVTWRVLHAMTGRTVYVLRYDAQEMPWPQDQVPRTPLGMLQHGAELRRRWIVARMAASGAGDLLAGWVRRWTRSGRRVLLAGFSLGAQVAWRAARETPSERLVVVLLSGAVGDTAGQWDPVAQMGRLVNVYSSRDLVLRHLYPVGVGADETPAAGLGPLVAPGLEGRVENVDATDLIGADHLWAASHLERLVRLALGCLWGGTMGPDGTCRIPGRLDTAVPEHLPEEVYARLLPWVIVDVRLWEDLGAALRGDAAAIARALALDGWSTTDGRRRNLLGLGRAATGLLGAHLGRFAAERGVRELSGVLRLWFGDVGPGGGSYGGAGSIVHGTDHAGSSSEGAGEVDDGGGDEIVGVKGGVEAGDRGDEGGMAVGEAGS